MNKPPAYAPDLIGFWSEFYDWLDTNAPELSGQFNLAIPIPEAHYRFFYDRCIAHVEQSEEIGRLKAQISDMVKASPGRIIERGGFRLQDFTLLARATDDKSGKKFELGLLRPEQEPMVFSQQCGRSFVLSWKDIAKLALDAGIDRASVIVP